MGGGFVTKQQPGVVSESMQTGCMGRNRHFWQIDSVDQCDASETEFRSASFCCSSK